MNKFPLRIILTGSLTVGSILTFLSYNIAGMKGIWIVAATIWGIVAFWLIKIKMHK